jgi:hypothetical protein
MFGCKRSVEYFAPQKKTTICLGMIAETPGSAALPSMLLSWLLVSAGVDFAADPATIVLYLFTTIRRDGGADGCLEESRSDTEDCQ